MVKGLAPQRKVPSTSPCGAVSFFTCVICLCGQYIIQDYVVNYNLYVTLRLRTPIFTKQTQLFKSENSPTTADDR